MLLIKPLSQFCMHSAHVTYLCFKLLPDCTHAIAHPVLHGIHLSHKVRSYFAYVRFYLHTYVTLQFCVGGIISLFSTSFPVQIALISLFSSVVVVLLSLFSTSCLVPGALISLFISLSWSVINCSTETILYIIHYIPLPGILFIISHFLTPVVIEWPLG